MLPMPNTFYHCEKGDEVDCRHSTAQPGGTVIQIGTLAIVLNTKLLKAVYAAADRRLDELVGGVRPWRIIPAEAVCAVYDAPEPSALPPGAMSSDEIPAARASIRVDDDDLFDAMASSELAAGPGRGAL